ncbi:MAG: NAD(P)-dependent oxidoreductase [Arenicellales bacterium]|jgi:citronellol/citronellal dehydrogenase|nr:NAD(P)-dependent oxidoreductase [Arenicellales bacterium]MDP6313880.1 NAD(P)-dependent oxidoreductase [Arenicellales bacterium]MDP7120152.1 NAD(P)-dependent oxidoreductase [Arenicellales bacterium]MDP7193788.1 NAD(P)-dependent oxidoreductase [Arenicellales bacterium]MDP7491261.1 NAD(P)-dependent oxidoreductase [Arenicellales bacterium]|tara:strand:- start:115 stop:990 length:876 start_codon:yes stop_codon:yes gene_type:complete
MGTFSGKRVIISGGSRGIGLAIGKRLAADGACIAILAKTTEPHPKLPGTIFTAAEEIEAAGGRALPIVTDIREEAQVKAAVAQAADEFGGLDILINNASAISLTPTAKTEMKRFDLMFAVNVRGTFMLSKECLAHLVKGDNPHILSISPPLDMQPKWFAPSVAYTISKFGMSQCVLGMAKELKTKGIGVNALWPHSVIATAAISNVVAGSIAFPHCRKPEIMADAAAVILGRDAGEFTGNFCIDDVLLSSEGVTDFSGYRMDPEKSLWSDFFVPDDIPEVEPLVMAMNPGG